MLLMKIYIVSSYNISDLNSHSEKGIGHQEKRSSIYFVIKMRGKINVNNHIVLEAANVKT